MRKVLTELTYARVVSTLALFLALGASGAWAISLGKNDVKSRNIAKGAVSSSDVRNDKLKSADVKGDALKGSDILESSLDTAQFSAAAMAPFTQDQPITCDPGLALTPCGSVALEAPVAGRILASASGELVPVNPTPDRGGRATAGSTSMEHRSRGYPSAGAAIGRLRSRASARRWRRDLTTSRSSASKPPGRSRPRSTGSRLLLVG